MNDTINLTGKNNPESGISQKEVISRPEEPSKEALESNCNQEPLEEMEVTTEETTIQTVFFELNEYLLDYPVYYSETEFFNKEYTRLCQNLLMADCHSVAIIGQDGCGKTSLVYHFAQKIINSQVVSKLEDAKVIEFSALSFPNSMTEIINELIIVAETYVSKGNDKLIFFFDNFERYPGCFWTNYAEILEDVANAFDESVSIKFIITMNTEYLDASEEMSREIIKSSLIFLVSQEVLVKEIITTLAPRISELKENHNIMLLDNEALNMIYNMELASVSQYVLSYEVYLTYIDKIMSEFEYRGIDTISYDSIRDYYLEREKTDDFFANKKPAIDVARHEAGHTLIALLLSEFLSFQGVTIIGISSMGYNGLTMIFSNSDTYWQTKENFIKFIGFYLAGRYAEKHFDRGALSDIQKANKYTRDYVCTSGVFKKLGKDFYCAPEDYEKLSPDKKEVVDEIVHKIIKKAKKYAIKKIEKHNDFVEALTEKLCEKKYLSSKEVLDLWSEFK